MEKEKILQQINELVAVLDPESKRKAWFDDEESDPGDRSGGKFDDAYDRGVQDGNTEQARFVLPRLLLIRNEIEAA